MKTKLMILAVATMLSASVTVSAQNEVVMEEQEYRREIKVRPFRIGSKVGFPNIIGGNLEYVTPLLNKKLAVSFDYSLIKSDWLGLKVNISEDEAGNENSETPNLDINYMGGGINYYFL